VIRKLRPLQILDVLYKLRNAAPSTVQTQFCLPTYGPKYFGGGWGCGEHYRKQTYFSFRPELIIMHFVAFAGKLAITSVSLVVIAFQLFNPNIPF